MMLPPVSFPKKEARIMKGKRINMMSRKTANAYILKRNPKKSLANFINDTNIRRR